jgi:D-glucosaminate-6-phosphate ammonia-lyase
MMYFLNSSTNQGSIKHEEFVKIARQHKIPTLIDAAADVPAAAAAPSPSACG